MGYTKIAFTGLSWLTALRIVTRIISLGKTAIVARFLNPAQFGVFGVATIVLSFVEVVTETGVNIVLIQHKESVDKFLPTAWLISIIRGIVIALIMVISSPFIADFFNAPDVISLILVMSLVPFLRGFINPAVVKLQKELLFRREFIFRAIILLIEVLITIILLYFNPEPVSLIWGLVVGALTEMVLSFFIVKPRPTLAINSEYLRKIMNQGKWITGGVIFNYGFERGDDIAIGRLLGTQSLGIYDMAYRFSLLPISEVASMVIKVVFPVFVKIADDYDRLKRAYFRTMGVVILVIAPFGIILFIFTETIILIVLGEQWLAAAPVLRVLAVLGTLRGIVSSISSILMGLGKQQYLTLISFIAFAGMIAFLIPFISAFGVVGAAYAATAGYMISIPFVLYFSLNELHKVKLKMQK